MRQVRAATAADRDALRALWAECFGDSDAFMDWFFAERFYPSLSTCLVEDGRIVSALHSCPVHVQLRGRILPASLLAGVATNPAYRGRGYMRRIVAEYMQNVRLSCVPVVVQTPAELPLYYSMGHYPATDTQHLYLDNVHAPALPENVRAHSLLTELAPLHACYRRAFAGYSGVLSRSLADFSLKFRDYASDGAECLVLWEQETVRGYCVYFSEEARLHAEEVAARDAQAYRTLLDALGYAANGRGVHMKLPPALVLSCPGARMETRPQGVMGVANVSALLAAILGDASWRFAVSDATVPQNAGIWNGAGEADTRAPQFSIEAGRLGQLLGGYASVPELVDAGHLTVHDELAAQSLDALLPKQPCYIVDEY